MKLPRASLAALLTAQAQETFNDCAAKMMLGALAQQLARAAGEDPKPVVGLIAALLVLPYVLFGPICGWLSDRFPKRTVLNGTLVSQIVVMLILVAALWMKSFWGAMFGFFLLSAETAVLAPAKRGILLEYVGNARLSRWVGYMEMLNITAILVGSFAGGWMFSHWYAASGDPWQAALHTSWVLTGLAVVAWAFFQVAQPTKSQSSEPFRWSLWVRHFADVIEVWSSRPLWRATMGICFFYGVGGYATVLLQQVGFELTHGGPAAALTSSKMMLMIGVGTMFGNLLAGLLSRRGVELGLAPIGGVLLVGSLLALANVHPASTAFMVLLAVTGFSTGFFLVPLYAFIQENAGDHRRGRVLAGVALLDSLAGAAAAGVYSVVASDAALGWSVGTQFYLMAAMTAAMLFYALWHIPHHTACTVMRLIGPIFYRVRAIGWENIPSGGALVICNHLSYVDAVVLQIASPRPMRFIAFAGFVKNPVMRFLFRTAGVIPVTANKPMKGIRLAIEAIEKGELVCVFPEGAISRTGQLMRLQRGFGLISEAAHAPVVPAVIDGLWGSIYSFAGNKYLWKSPRLMPTPVCVMFGAPMAPADVTLASARQALLDLGEAAFQERPVLKRHLAREAVRALAKNPRHVAVIDRTSGRQEVKAGQLLAVAVVLARRLRATVPGKRVGIVLPPGAGANIANLAIACAGKVPVNLNFTAGRAAIEASLRLGEIDTVITAEAMKPKVPNFPFPPNTLDLKTEITAAGGKRAIVPWLLAAHLLPNQWVADLVGLPRTGDREEAALLFTSGSSGEPKGVVLTHRNILANCAQISSLSILPESAKMLGCLPIFHSFGFTVTLWYPLLRGCNVVTVPSPLDTKKIVEAIQQEQATVMIGAPTFIRPFLKKATKEELKSLELVVTGAEKLPMDLYDAFLTSFGIEILQGYGLTETTPAASINQYHPPITTTTAEHQEGKRTGSVGRLLPGSTARIVDPDTGATLPSTSTGMLWLKGPHVFPGYLKDEKKTAEALREGDWFVTGDLGRLDEDGFLFIEGRLSRFSKIGGEMVPHGTIEQRLIAAFDWDQSEGLVAVVTGIPDPTKGEALVLLTTRDVAMADVRSKLLEVGYPNLWVPKVICKVESIPVLGTGKTDLKACRNLAIELAAAQQEG
jgi:acyl-[acyl-carrier-protein]-phospholipid O-acyltransferase/long-chain-fatty-acid--[acyl-carrier-protein] ligase